MVRGVTLYAHAETGRLVLLCATPEGELRTPAVRLQASCIGCGCTSDDACNVDGAPCGWLALEDAAGLCTGCAEHLPRWERGERCIDIETPDLGDEEAE